MWNRGESRRSRKRIYYSLQHTDYCLQLAELGHISQWQRLRPDWDRILSEPWTTWPSSYPDWRPHYDRRLEQLRILCNQSLQKLEPGTSLAQYVQTHGLAELRHLSITAQVRGDLVFLRYTSASPVHYRAAAEAGPLVLNAALQPLSFPLPRIPNFDETFDHRQASFWFEFDWKTANMMILPTTARFVHVSWLSGQWTALARKEQYASLFWGTLARSGLPSSLCTLAGLPPDTIATTMTLPEEFRNCTFTFLVSSEPSFLLLARAAREGTALELPADHLPMTAITRQFSKSPQEEVKMLALRLNVLHHRAILVRDATGHLLRLQGRGHLAVQKLTKHSDRVLPQEHFKKLLLLVRTTFSEPEAFTTAYSHFAAAYGALRERLVALCARLDADYAAITAGLTPGDAQQAALALNNSPTFKTLPSAYFWSLWKGQASNTLAVVTAFQLPGQSQSHLTDFLEQELEEAS
jgi:hypothetical protein